VWPQFHKQFPDVQWGSPPVLKLDHWWTKPPGEGGLEEEELQILNSLADAWNRFVALAKKHPDDNDEFRRAIHQAQQLVALRVARRVNPQVWYQPEGL
jgi:hypothetical protein